LFGESGVSAAAEFGTRVHALLAAVEWRDGAEARRLAEAMPGDGGEEGERALREVEACVRAPRLARVFSKTNPADEVWRERGFEAVVDGAWVSGVLDRVVVRRVPGGRIEAEVFDFKTERTVDVDELRRRHAGQLRWYTAVVGRLLGVEPEAVRAYVVATAEQALVEMVRDAR
jgi:ATP-dependent exoDNAse (exonuclease V) beta subunit